MSRRDSLSRSPSERTRFATRPRADSRIQRRLSSATDVQLLDKRLKWIFLALGMAVLLSWNVLITATPYFLSRLEGHRLKGTFNSYLSLSYTAANFISLAYATASAHTADTSRRIRQSASIILVLQLLLAISPIMPLHRGVFFAFVLLNGILQSAAGSFLQSAVVGLTSLFGPEAMATMFTGQAVVGVAVSAVQYLSAASSSKTKSPKSPSSPEAAAGETVDLSLFAFVFFGLASAFMALALAAHSYLLRLPSYHAVVDPIEQRKGLIAEDEVETPEEEDLERENEPFLAHSVDMLVPGTVSIKHIAKLNVVYNFSVAWVFIITLAVYPPITSTILSTHTGSSLSFFSPVLFVSFHFLLFNIADWLGRYICSYPQYLIWTPRKILALSLSRTLFIPLFLACNVSRPLPSLPSSSLSSITITASPAPLFNSDLIYFLILLLFGLSNGYVSTMSMMASSSLEHNSRLKKEEIDTAATVAQFCLVGGLAVGSVVSFGVRGVVCQCNPLFG